MKIQLTVCILFMMKPTKWHAQRRLRSPWASTQTDQSLLCALWIAKDPNFLQADSEDWSDWPGTQTDLSLCWVHMSFCSFCLVGAQCIEPTSNYQLLYLTQHFVAKLVSSKCLRAQPEGFQSLIWLSVWHLSTLKTIHVILSLFFTSLQNTEDWYKFLN